MVTAHSLVPTIDVSAPIADQLPALDAACRDHGFFLLTGHGLDELIGRTWTAARAFFDSDRSNKLSVARDLKNPLGWNDRELTKLSLIHI